MYLDEKCLEIETELEERFQSRKVDSWPLIESYRRLGLVERADKVQYCGSVLDFKVPEDFASPAKLYQANFCKDRLCGMCAWRRSLKVFAQLSEIMDVLQADHDYQFVFVTLTVRNCSGKMLPMLLDRFSHGFHLFNQRARVKRAFKGSFKAVEITYHPDHPRDLQYHPHLHIVYAVNKSYFKSADYLSHDDIMYLWRECMDLGYDPVVHIQKVKPNVNEDGEISLGKAVAEISKYTVKPEDIFVNNTEEQIDSAVLTLSGALAGRRLCSYTGIFKKIAKQLKLDDLTDGDLVLTGKEKLRTDVRYLIVTYKWGAGVGYERTCVRYDTKENVE